MFGTVWLKETDDMPKNPFGTRGAIKKTPHLKLAHGHYCYF
jgi:hypothetical protein